MKRIFKIALWSVLGLVLLLFMAGGLFIYKARYGFNFYETDEPELPADLSGKAILLFSKTNGFRHGEAIEASIPAFEKMAADNGWALYATDEGGVFNAKQLPKFDVVIWNNCSGKVLNEEQRETFKNYLESGGGYVGIHASGDNSHQWEWYEDNVIGARFSHHTMDPHIQSAAMHLEDAPITLSQGLPAAWDHEDEWYMFYNNPRERSCRVLYTVDETHMEPGGSFPLLASDKDWGMGEDHPIVWYRQVGRGRALYSSATRLGRSQKQNT